MATYYLDPEGGSDANNGTSFALRKRTIGSFASLAGGDVVRIMASRDPKNLGMGTWTDNSDLITLAAAKTLEIYPCTAAWTAATNVTSTTSTTRKFGATSSSISPATAFVTGKAAHQVLAAPLDLSAYTAVSFWLFFNSNGSISGDGGMQLNLCSDTTGDVVVDSFPIQFSGGTTWTISTWLSMCFEKGSALGSAIQSISITFTIDPGSSPSFLINNLFACQGRNHADHLSLQSIFGKDAAGEPEWYPLLSISGAQVRVSPLNASSGVATRNYRGTSETVTTYCVAPTSYEMNSAARILNNNGATNNPIMWSGGWNRTDMSTQTARAESWWTACGIYGGIFSTNGGAQWISFENVGIANSSSGFTLNINSPGIRNFSIKSPGFVGTKGDIACHSGTEGHGQQFSLGNVVFTVGTIKFGGSLNYASYLRARRITGSLPVSSAALEVGPAAMLLPRNQRVAWVDMIDNCNAFGVAGLSGGFGGTPVLRGALLRNNTTADVNTASGLLALDNCTFQSTNRQFNNSTSQTSGVLMTCINGDRSLSAIYAYSWNAVTQSTVRHAATGVAWEVTPNSSTNITSLAPAPIPLALIPVAANETVTIKVWMRRADTGTTVGMRVRGGSLPGLNQDYAVVTAAAINTWVEEQISFTPTAEGVVELEGFVYGTAGSPGYFDDLTVT